MARPIADRASGRIALLGAASPAGAHVKTALADRGVAGARVDLYGHQTDVAVLSEYDGEARLVQSAGDLTADGCAALFVCEPGHDHDALATAAASGALVIDLTGSVPGTVLAGSAASPSTRLIAIPHPLTTLLGALLAPVRAAVGLAGVSAFVLRPASDFGEPGLEELREQTVRLLRFESTPTEVFGRQLAFNVIPEHLFPAAEENAGMRVVAECRALLDAPDLPLSLSLALAPVFYGHAIALHAATEKPGRDLVIAALRAAPGVRVASDEDLGTTLDAPEEPGVTVVRVEDAGPSAFAIWALGSEAGAAAAAGAISIAARAGVL
jgi:aspartate-semialdehyde dehydrogenase